MTTLLEIREWMRKFYSKYSLYIQAGLKFLTMLVVTITINNSLGFNTRLNSLVVALVLAMVCAFLPASVMTVFAAGIILLHLYSVSLELTVIVLILFVIILLLYFRFSPKYAFALLLTPIALAFKLPLLVPLVLGICATPVSMIPASLGGIVYFLLHNISISSVSLMRLDDKANAQAYLVIVENTMKSSQMYMTLLTIIITILLVYVIRRLSIDHSWTIAIVTGTFLDVFIFLIGDFVLDLSLNAVGILIGAIVALVIAFILQFFLFSVDYSRTEHVQFEDDEYYYYVKAVPKMNIAKREKKVKRINPQKKVKDDRKINKKDLDI